ncbi:MAG: hypothetical protein RLZZ234_97 [Candidatus Parcubacteria bacterium]|jgi:DNA polymerase III delta prime subunit
MSIELLHHATLIRGNREAVVRTLEEVLDIPFTRIPHSDIVYTLREQLSIEDVRELSRVSLQRPLSHAKLTLIIAADSIGHEAQNALLKLTEDPPASARFVFILPQSSPLLPTLRSRVVEHNMENGEESTTEAFVSLPLRDALREITRATKDKDERVMERILISLEHRAAERVEQKGTPHALLTARRYIEARGASPKMLLEHALLEQRESELR